MNKKLVITKDVGDTIDAPVLERAIVDIATGMRKALTGRLTRKAIVVLIAYHSKVAMRDIEIVINNLEDLDNTWLSKKK